MAEISSESSFIIMSEIPLGPDALWTLSPSTGTRRTPSFELWFSFVGGYGFGGSGILFFWVSCLA